MSAIRVSLQEARAHGLCARGIADWARRAGIPWARLRAEGVPADLLLASGDGRLIALARAVIAARSAGVADG